MADTFPDDVQAGLRKVALRFKFNMDQLAKKYEKLDQEADVSVELDCDTNKIIQVLKPGAKVKTNKQLFDAFSADRFERDAVFSCPNVDSIEKGYIKRQVVKQNKEFEEYFAQTEQRRKDGKKLFDSDDEGVDELSEQEDDDELAEDESACAVEDDLEERDADLSKDDGYEFLDTMMEELTEFESFVGTFRS